MSTCEIDFNIRRTKFERVVSGIKQAGGHIYQRKKLVGDDEKPTGTVQLMGKSQNLIDKGQAGSTTTTNDDPV